MADAHGKSIETLPQTIEEERNRLAVHLRELRRLTLDRFDVKKRARKALGHLAARFRLTLHRGVETARAHSSLALVSAGALTLLCVGAWRLRRRSHRFWRWR